MSPYKNNLYDHNQLLRPFFKIPCPFNSLIVFSINTGDIRLR